MKQQISTEVSYRSWGQHLSVFRASLLSYSVEMLINSVNLNCKNTVPLPMQNNHVDFPNYIDEPAQDLRSVCSCTAVPPSFAAGTILLAFLG